MELYLLRPKEPYGHGRKFGNAVDNDPWELWFTKAFGFVVRAETELEARCIADNNAGDENSSAGRHPWLNDADSVCLELTADGPAGEIMRDFADS